MKYCIPVIILFLFVTSCNDTKEKPSKEEPAAPSVVAAKDSVATAKPLPDTVLLVLKTRQVLSALKKHDLNQFASFIHPALGARFSPYGYIDTVLHRLFLPQQLVKTSLSGNKIFWGYYDGSGDSINLNVSDYFKKFVYNTDFLGKGTIGINRMIGSGNSLNNLQSVYKDAGFIEIHIPGFNPKYGGMDWSSLRLVYRKVKSEFYLVAVVHDQWTI